MTFDDYMASRMITHAVLAVRLRRPVRRRDGGDRVACGSRRATCAHPPLRVEVDGRRASHGRPSWDQFDDLTTMANRDAGAQLWSRTDLKPSDVQMLAGATTGSRSSRCRGSRRSGSASVGESGPFIEGGAAHRA